MCVCFCTRLLHYHFSDGILTIYFLIITKSGRIFYIKIHRKLPADVFSLCTRVSEIAVCLINVPRLFFVNKLHVFLATVMSLIKKKKRRKEDVKISTSSLWLYSQRMKSTIDFTVSFWFCANRSFSEVPFVFSRVFKRYYPRESTHGSDIVLRNVPMELKRPS